MKENEEISEKELVEGCISFDRKYQELFYRKFADKMFNVCLIYTNNDKDEASDILQDSFIHIFKKIHQYNFNGSLEGWVRRIIVNKSLENFRKKKWELDKANVYNEYSDKSIDDIISRISYQEIVDYINKLPHRAQIVLKLYTIEGYSHKEISEMLNITEGTSKSQLNRARFLLNKILSQNK